MYPHYTDRHQYCEYCDEVIFIGYEAELSPEGYFCSEECAKEHLYVSSDFKKIYLSNDFKYRSVD